jgi:nitronate monooxygenase
MALPKDLADRLALPLIAAPMFLVSGPDLVVEACRAGVIGAFPTVNCRTGEELDAWLAAMKRRVADAEQGAGRRLAPLCPNILVHPSNPRRDADVRTLIAHGVELVIASVGNPAPVIPALHDAGCRVFADVASLRHAEKAIEAGSDGLVLLTAGAGGQTGWANPFAFVRAVRTMWDGPLVLAGGISDGQALFAARALGCDLAYMGTRFIATRESMADDRYKAMLVASRRHPAHQGRDGAGDQHPQAVPACRRSRSRQPAGARRHRPVQGHQPRQPRGRCRGRPALEGHLERRPQRIGRLGGSFRGRAGGADGG